MNILLTVHIFFPENSAGTEVLTLGVAKDLISRGHTVNVLTVSAFTDFDDRDDKVVEYDYEGVHVIAVKKTPANNDSGAVDVERFYYDRDVTEIFRSLMERIRPDIVHFFHFNNLGTGMIEVVNSLDIPAYFTPTDFWTICPQVQLRLPSGDVCRGPSEGAGNCVLHFAAITKGPVISKTVRVIPDFISDALVKIIDSRYFPSLTIKKQVADVHKRLGVNVNLINTLRGIFSPTKLMTDILTVNGIDKSLVIQSPFGIDISPYSSCKHKNITDVDEMVIGFIGSLESHKGCHVLIDAFQEIRSDRVKLRIYGDNTVESEYLSQLYKKAENNDSIEFCGTFPNKDIAEILSNIHVLVIPSQWYENTPLVMLSSMAAKCPIIASDYPGLSEVVVDGHNGNLFCSKDVGQLRDILEGLNINRHRINEMSANCMMPKSSSAYVDEMVSIYIK